MTVTYRAAQTAGNLNVVAIGWSTPTAVVTGDSDSRGNMYSVAAGPTVQAGMQAHVIYYAPNIGAAAANANAVTVTFNAAVAYPDVRIAEYSGMESGQSARRCSGSSGDGDDEQQRDGDHDERERAAGGRELRDIVDDRGGVRLHVAQDYRPNGNILEDRVVTAVGTYSATAAMFSGSWVMQVVALRAAGGGGGGDTQAPTFP